jgi:hypothetical protein
MHKLRLVWVEEALVFRTAGHALEGCRPVAGECSGLLLTAAPVDAWHQDFFTGIARYL